jgi:hypothetical protein
VIPRRAASIFLAFVVCAVLFVSFTPFAVSRRLRHRSKLAIAKAEILFNKWRGNPPRLVSIAGQVDQPGAEVQALDSRSGWAAMSDQNGRFVLPDVLWYPGASYDILLSTDYDNGKFARISTSSTLPESSVIQAGLLVPASDTVSLTGQPGVNSFSREPYDYRNRDYYVDLYHKLTDGKQSDEQKVQAVNEFVGTRLNYEQTGKELGSARRVIEQGSQWCGHLAVAMATIIVTGYPARIIHLMDTSVPPKTHALVEVYYGGDWHLYDPTFGVRFMDEAGRVASYRTLRLNPGLVLDSAYDSYRRLYPAADSVTWMPEIYRSGYHHFFLIEFK